MKKNISNFVLVLILLAGLSLLLYPTVADVWNSMHQSRAIASYTDTVAGLDSISYDDVWSSAREYNQTLVGRGVDRFFLTEEEKVLYESLLDVNESGVMGYIEIGRLGVKMPIYHGTSEGVLQVAIGHIEGTSLPVGGRGSHSVLSGHRGLPSAKLFTDIDKMVEGDTFQLYILDEVLTYQVDQILVVLPNEMEALTIEDGADYCTMVTCTPYGINSHRLLVRGHRVDNSLLPTTIHVPSDAVLIDPLMVAPIVAVPMLLVLLLILLLPKRRRLSSGGDDLAI